MSQAYAISPLSFSPSYKTLPITTYQNDQGQVFFKALGHPFLQKKRQEFCAILEAHHTIALFDPHGWASDFIALLGLNNAPIQGIFVNTIEGEDQKVAHLTTQPLPEHPSLKEDLVCVLDFTTPTILPFIQNLFPNAHFITLQDLKLPYDFLSDPLNYLSPLNFATNFALIKEKDGIHTRLTTLNYWHRYGAQNVRIACMLFNQEGECLAQWIDSLEDSEHLIVFESQTLRERFGLPPFSGHLFCHILGAKGHDIMKYALDFFSDTGLVYGTTHDANSWPSLFFAGLPAPRAQEDVILWLQNVHPVPIPQNTITIQVMGKEEISHTLSTSIPAFGVHPVSLRESFPHVSWPQQFEVQAGLYCVRPRYEVIHLPSARRTMSHINVEQNARPSDPKWPQIASRFGKGYLLVAPLLPRLKFHQEILQTPMSRLYQECSLKVAAYKPDGALISHTSLADLTRHHQQTLSVSEWLDSWDEHGHLELFYDQPGEVDGWLHALFRYQCRSSHHIAETSFGSHLFNDLTVYKNEPHSYSHTPPGLSTRLFLRLAPSLERTFCILIYPVSKQWLPFSSTTLMLKNRRGNILAEHTLSLPQNGSSMLWMDEIFNAFLVKEEGAYVTIRDKTCRIFGYHGTSSRKSFTLDHMFGC